MIAYATRTICSRWPVGTVTFTGSTIPDSIQIDMTRTAGVGVPWVTQTRGDLKNLSWRDDGTSNMRVILSTNHGAPLNDIKGFKFYVAGGVTGLEITNVVAYDVSGTPISDINADVRRHLMAYWRLHELDYY